MYKNQPITYKTRRYSGGLKDKLLRMRVKDKDKLNNPLKDWLILSAISSMVFHTVVRQWMCGMWVDQFTFDRSGFEERKKRKKYSISSMYIWMSEPFFCWSSEWWCCIKLPDSISWYNIYQYIFKNKNTHQYIDIYCKRIKCPK